MLGGLNISPLVLLTHSCLSSQISTTSEHVIVNYTEPKNTVRCKGKRLLPSTTGIRRFWFIVKQSFVVCSSDFPSICSSSGDLVWKLLLSLCPIILHHSILPLSPLLFLPHTGTRKVRQAPQFLNSRKLSGPDGTPLIVSKMYVRKFSPPLRRLCCLSLWCLWNAVIPCIS